MPLPKSLAPVFLTLTAFGVLQLHGPAARSGRFDLRPACTAPENPYRIPYTSNVTANGLLCILNTLFGIILAQPEGKDVTSYFLLSLGPLVAYLPQLESSRPGRSILLAAPTLVGVGCQLAGAGVFIPLFFLFYALGSPDTQVSQEGAERALISTLVGFVVPAFRILSSQAPRTLALFQVFPILVAGSGSVWSLLRRTIFGGQNDPHTAYVLVQSSYALIAAGSLYAHIQYVFARLGGTGDGLLALKRLFVPLYGRLHNVAPDLNAAAVDFIKWDLVVTAAATSIAALFTIDSPLDVVVFASVVVIAGPGAACSLLLALREARFEDERLKIKELKKQ